MATEQSSAGGPMTLACFEVGTHLYALDVSHVREVVRWRNFFPRLAAEAGYEAVRAVVRRPGRDPTLVLSMENILDSVSRAACSCSEVA